MSDLGDTTPEGHRFKRGVGNSSSTAVSSFLSLRRLGLFWYFSSGGEGKRLAPVRLRAHRAAAPSFSFKKPRGSPPALRGAGREAPAWGVTYRSAATGAPRAPRPNRAGAAARLLRCPPRLRLHLPPLSQDLPEAWTVAPGGGGGSEGGGGQAGAIPFVRSIFRWAPVSPVRPRASLRWAGRRAGPSEAALFLSLFTRFQWQLHHRVSVRLELGLGLFWLHWSFCFSSARFKWWLHRGLS